MEAPADLISSPTLQIYTLQYQGIYDTNTLVLQDSRYVIERSGMLTPLELEITSTIGARKIVSDSQ
jgi:hypothetical protein